MDNYFNLKEGEEIEIDLGDSFNPKSRNFFHNVRFDFKPASIDQKKMATVNVTENQVELTFPHKDEGKETTFKGTSKRIQKECVLICDNESGKWTLETISTLTQARYTRAGDSNPVGKVSPQSANNKISPQNKPKLGTTPVSNPSSKQHTLQHQESKLSADSDVDEDDANADDISKIIQQTLNDSDSESSDSSDSDSSSSSEDEQQIVSDITTSINQDPVAAPVAASNSQDWRNDLLMSSDDSD